jgi:hypothetical protein
MIIGERSITLDRKLILTIKKLSIKMNLSFTINWSQMTATNKHSSSTMGKTERDNWIGMK